MQTNPTHPPTEPKYLTDHELGVVEHFIEMLVERGATPRHREVLTELVVELVKGTGEVTP